MMKSTPTIGTPCKNISKLFSDLSYNSFLKSINTLSYANLWVRILFQALWILERNSFLYEGEMEREEGGGKRRREQTMGSAKKASLILCYSETPPK